MTHGWNMKSVEIATADGHLRCLKAAINAGADVNNVNKENRYTPLMWAAKYGQYECIEALIEAGADVNKTVSGDSPLWYTSFYTEDTRCVELLLDAGADVNYMNVCGTVLMKAAWSGHKDTVDVLIKTGADVNIVNTADGDGFTALTMCAKSPDGWRCIDSLVKAGADVNAVCGGEFFSGGTSALMWAIYCEEPNEKALEELVKAGADVNMADENGTTALHASVNKEDRSFEILMNAGADVNIQNKDGCTPLAILNGYNTKRAETLVEAGAEIPQDILFSVGFCNSANFIRLCLHHYIKINQKNEKGNNALEHYLTGSMSNEEVCMLLHAAGENLRKVRFIQYTLSFVQLPKFGCEIEDREMLLRWSFIVESNKKNICCTVKSFSHAISDLFGENKNSSQFYGMSQKCW